ncbi:unnamed protein product [Arabis nemorensis]|uniref:Retrovirus-related Pol polyprotein from transposon TNT 1-94-like beta-barrel domain-containing protein n=1 Tax=Arabis nemorensis TaxID=586526 RepID=A0A565BLM3_9BRAS|nr:unnamed protein product [Arabis nemorensis]
MEERGSSKMKNKGKKRPFEKQNQQQIYPKQRIRITVSGKDIRIKAHPLIKDNEVMWWIDSGARTNVCKDHDWFKTYEPVKDGSVLHMENEPTAPILGRGKVKLDRVDPGRITVDKRRFWVERTTNRVDPVRITVDKRRFWAERTNSSGPNEQTVLGDQTDKSGRNGRTILGDQMDKSWQNRRIVLGSLTDESGQNGRTVMG